MPGFPVLHHLPEFARIRIHEVSDALFSLSQTFPLSGSFPMSQLYGTMVAIVLELQLQHQSFQWIFRIDRFDLLAVQGTLKSFLQHHNSKASTFWHSDFFMAQLSHLHTTTGKTTALTIWTSDGKVMPLLCNMLSRLVIAFLPRSKHLLISWLQSLSTVILEPKKIKSVTVSTLSLSVCYEVMGLGAMTLGFWMLSFRPAFSLSSYFHQEAL